MKAKWDKLQAQYRRLQEEIDDLELDLVLKYGADNWRTWSTKTEMRPILSRRARQDKIGNQLLEILDATPRQWRSGPPYWWIMMELSYEDAIKPLSEPLSVVPPVPYGGTLESMRRFAGV